jgi:S-adenosylmethionine:tRNA ribosyltransferase-isomerase
VERPTGERLADYDYDLPPEGIARRPAEPRDSSRLLVLDPRTGRREHRVFRDLPEYLAPGDLLVLNDTRVLPRRVLGRRGTGGAVEALLLSRRLDGTWRALVSARRPLAEGEALVFEEGALAARVVGRGEEGGSILSFEGGPDVERVLEEVGRAPLPPYLRRSRVEDGLRSFDRGRYQTVYARDPGAVAAPTAGLHFTPDLLGTLEAGGVRVARVTLHVGPGTFLPVRDDPISSHRIEPERYRIDPEAAAAIAAAKAAGARIVAVGTTVVRSLEGAALEDGTVRAGEGETSLFVRPPFRFRVVSSLLTNFHLPRSTLLMLVAAFAGRERILEAYREAVERGYRFYSYGDAMLILGPAPGVVSGA